MITKLTMIPPATVSIEALQGRQAAIFVTVPGFLGAIAVYCRRNQAGALWLPTVNRPGEGTWTSMSPVTIDEFLQALQAQGVKFDQGPDLNRWVAHVTDQSGGAN